jgi:hypothetical protein
MTIAKIESMKVEYGVGEQIYKAIKDAIALSELHDGCTVEFEFNDVTASVDKNSDAALADSQYSRALRKPIVTGKEN